MHRFSKLVAVRGARYLSGGSSSATSGSTNTSSDESLKIPGLSKYVLYAAPGLTIATLAIWTINDKNVRRFIETRISSHFVWLVRSTYGFSDEDLVTQRTQEMTAQYQSKPVCLQVILADGSAQELEVNGESPYSEVRSSLEKQGLRVRNVCPKDDTLEEHTQIDETSARENPARGNSLVDSLIRSSWDTSLATYSTSSAAAASSRIDARVFLPWFDAVICNRIKTFESYLKWGNLDRLLVPLKKKRQLPRHIQRIEVQQTIREVEGVIKGLQTEMQIGRKSSDEVEREIAVEQAKIAELRRFL